MLQESKKNGEENLTTISYKINFIDSVRFMTIPLSNLVNNLTEEVDKIKCKDCDCFLEYKSFKDNLTYKCLSCNKNNSNTIEEE